MYIKKSQARLKKILKSLQEGKLIKDICTEAGISAMTLHRWCKESKHLKERMRFYKTSALENALQVCALGGFSTKVTKKYNLKGLISEETIQTAAPNIAALIFSLSNLKTDEWKNNRDHYFGERDEKIKESTYEILDTKDNIEAEKLLKEFTK